MVHRGRKRRLPRSPFLNPQFEAAAKEFGAALIKSGSIEHRGNKGGAREEYVRDFFRARLPKSFAVAQGEVVDLNGTASPQLDVMFYNQTKDFALVAGSTEILAAEALLASIEVKSKLTKAEIEKSALAARAIRELRPYDKPLGGTNVRESAQSEAIGRYYHCIFAFDSDLGKENWLSGEFARVRVECGGEHVIDALYVLGRGLLNLTSGMGLSEDASGCAISNFYFSILNFIQRESGRRRETPYYRYFTNPRDTWVKVSA